MDIIQCKLKRTIIKYQNILGVSGNKTKLSTYEKKSKMMNLRL